MQQINKNTANRPKTNKDKTVLAKIIGEFKDRNRAEIRKWQQAISLANDPENPRSYLLQDLYDNLEADGHYTSQIGLRKAASLGNSFAVIDRKSGDNITDKTELLNTEWFYNLMNDILDVVYKGYTLIELTNPATLDFTVIPRRNVAPKKQRVYFEAAGDKFIDYSSGFETSIIQIGKSDNIGLLAKLCGQLIWKRNAQQSWAEFSEKFGMPLITATTNKSSKTDLDKIESMLMALGEAARAVLPEGTTIDIKPFQGGDSFNVYDKQIERINSEISKPITGGTMISDDGSSRSQSEVHERNLDNKLSQPDRKMIEFVVNGQLFPILQYWGYPLNPLTDKFTFEDTYDLTLKEHWDIVNSALYHFDVPTNWISKTFNIPIIGEKPKPTFPGNQNIIAQLQPVKSIHEQDSPLPVERGSGERLSANFQ